MIPYPVSERTLKKLRHHFSIIYGEEKVQMCIGRTLDLVRKYKLEPAESVPFQQVWTHKDHVLITYGDMVQPEEGEPESKLRKQHQFLKQKLKDVVSTVHILPFFPSSSDDGFSIVDYRRVDERMGNWDDIEGMSQDFRLMCDLVMNHTSRHSEWFKKFLLGEKPYRDYYIDQDPEAELSAVTRPRSSSLLTQVHTSDISKHIWTTFSNDQMDVQYANPDVLFEYLDIFFFYLSKGISVVRLDAVAFIWKQLGTSCIHLPETHEIVKLMRTLIETFMPEVSLITETNVPHKENISYFGNGDETHMVYQFSLPPLLMHAILTENGNYLTEWVKSLNELPDNCTYLNFTSSHDGIGVRPLEGLIPEDEFAKLILGIEKKGGFVSEKKNPDGTHSPYELNITYFDAFSGLNGTRSLQEKRYLCSQIISMSLKGVPAIYFHNFTATKNNLHGVATTGRYRTINRKKWKYDELMGELSDPDTATSRVFEQMKQIISARKEHPAFHPFGGQETIKLQDDLFCLLRWDPDQTEKVLVLANLSRKRKALNLSEKTTIISSSKSYCDILSKTTCIRDGRCALDPFQVVWVKI